MSENIGEGDIYSYSQDETYEEWIRPSSRLIDVCGKDMALCGHSRIVFGITYEKHERIIKEKDREIEKLKQDLRHYAINVCPDKDRELDEKYKEIAGLKAKLKEFGVLGAPLYCCNCHSYQVNDRGFCSKCHTNLGISEKKAIQEILKESKETKRQGSDE
jgi:hypothetical protein